MPRGRTAPRFALAHFRLPRCRAAPRNRIERRGLQIPDCLQERAAKMVAGAEIESAVSLGYEPGLVTNNLPAPITISDPVRRFELRSTRLRGETSPAKLHRNRIWAPESNRLSPRYQRGASPSKLAQSGAPNRIRPGAYGLEDRRASINTLGACSFCVYLFLPCPANVTTAFVLPVHGGKSMSGPRAFKSGFILMALFAKHLALLKFCVAPGG